MSSSVSQKESKVSFITLLAIPKGIRSSVISRAIGLPGDNVVYVINFER